MAQEGANSQPTRRRLMQYAGLALATVYLSEPSAALAAEPQEAVSPNYPDQISDVMERLSDYMSQARDKDLPNRALEQTKWHVLDTLAARRL